VTQKEADRFNDFMEARRLPHRARIERTGTPHFVIEPPLPPEMVSSDYSQIFRNRDTRRQFLVENRDATVDPGTVRRLDLMIDEHDRGTDRIRSRDPEHHD
jgi:hypothetical protein